MKRTTILLSACLGILFCASLEGMDQPTEAAKKFQSTTEYKRLKQINPEALWSAKKYKEVNQYLFDWAMLYQNQKYKANVWRTALVGDDETKKRIEWAANTVKLSPGTISDFIEMAGKEGTKQPQPKDLDEAIKLTTEAANAVIQAAKNSDVKETQSIAIKKIGRDLQDIKFKSVK